MKEHPVRDDNQCLNCGATVPERYCSHCGQENIAPHESFGHLLQHFVADIVHYDSKALSTLKYLLFRPGYLTKAYTAGKRVSYVNPIKLYVFISFVFFLLYALLPSDETTVEKDHSGKKSNEEIVKDVTLNLEKEGVKMPIDLKAELKDTTSGDLERIAGILQTVDSTADAAQAADSARKKKPNRSGLAGILRPLNYKTPERYDSIQHALPEAQRDGVAKRRTIRRMLYLQSKYGNDIGNAIKEAFTHNIPKLMFILLPLFALLLKWIYDKRKWLYADHGIFSIHFHTFLFILLLIAKLLDGLLHTSAFTEWSLLVGLIYLAVALKNMYGQSWRRSAAKAVSLVFLYSTFMVIVFLGYILLVMAIIL